MREFEENHLIPISVGGNPTAQPMAWTRLSMAERLEKQFTLVVPENP